MLLSDIIKDMEHCGHVTIKDEKPFEYLALTASVVGNPICVFLDSKRYIKDIKPNVEMVITNVELAPLMEDSGYGLCIVDSPREFFFRLHNHIADMYDREEHKSKTEVGTRCKISSLSSIARHNVKIGENVIIEEYVVIRENTIIGDNSIIRAGSIIGGEGFEFKRLDNTIMGVRHVWGVKIGRSVEVQYNTCIDKAVYPWDDTVIGDYTKIDNLTQIGHAVKIGERCLIAGQSVIGGRTVIKDDVWIGPGVTISNALIIDTNSRVNLGSVVVSSVNKNESITGNYAIDTRKFLKHMKKIELS